MRVSNSGAFASGTRLLLITASIVVAAGLVGCDEPRTAIHYNKGKEHFAQGKKWGRASPKLIADGEAVPRGGGQYLVGRPYHVAGKTYVPHEDDHYSVVGMASWYGAAFHGRRTSNGEIYDMSSITAAHPTMPLPSYARVTNLSNGYSVIVRVNDRGPFSSHRVMDVSARAAEVLGFKNIGTAKIKVDYVGRAPLEGSDDNMLLASLRTDGTPANLDGYPSSGTMIASAGASAFGGLFSSAARRRPNRPRRPRPSRPPRRSLEPEPVQVAATETTAPSDATTEDVAPGSDDAPPAHALRQPRGPVPMPPPRPFDLGEIRATLKVAELRSTTVHKPRRSPSCLPANPSSRRARARRCTRTN